jgi:sec-independent protein translocase protein TatB
MGEGKILLIMLLALIVLGPEKLPKLAADIGRWVGRARSLARQLTTQLDQEVRLEEVMRDQRVRNATNPAPAVAPPPPGDTTHSDTPGISAPDYARAAPPATPPPAASAEPETAAAAVSEAPPPAPPVAEERTAAPRPEPIARTDVR